MAIEGCVYLQFGDIRDADEALSTVKMHCPGWKASYIGTRSLVEKFQPTLVEHLPLSLYEGQILVSAIPISKSAEIDPESTGQLIHNLLRQHGDVMLFQFHLMSQTEITYHAEFFNTDAVISALANIEGLGIRVSLCD